MSATVHRIDPDPDTLIILKNASTNFAEWDDEVKPENAAIEEHERENEQPALDPVNEIVGTIPLLGGILCSMNGSSAAAAPLATTTVEPIVPVQKKTEVGDTIYRVSSRHLMLASRWFKRALAKGTWAESSCDAKNGLYHIVADGWDAEALLILLNIIHLRHKAIPQRVNLEMMAKIAVLVDYYEFGDETGPYTHKWIEVLKNQTAIPSTYCRDLVLWICISWIFGDADVFRTTTFVAMKQGGKSLRTLGLPIPEAISHEIDARRSEGIHIMLDGLSGLLSDYRSENYVCEFDNQRSNQCGSMLFGTLTRQLDALGFHPPHVAMLSSETLPFHEVARTLKYIESPEWYSYDRLFSRHERHKCNLTKVTKGLVMQANGIIKGLDLRIWKYGGKGLSRGAA